MVLSATPATKSIGGIFALLGTLYSLATLVPSLAAAARRAHDTGRTGWVLLVPIYGLVVLCSDSAEGPNKWGPDPKGRKTQEVVPPPFQVAA
jgi:uncharacterized membrane protein YhaH (DUF805 family)